MFIGNFFITPHAVRQFQTRIAPRLTYEQALGAIIRGMQDAKEFRATENGQARYTRINGPWQFRAVVQDGAGDKPAVITILRSGRGKRRPGNEISSARTPSSQKELCPVSGGFLGE